MEIRFEHYSGLKDVKNNGVQLNFDKEKVFLIY